MFIFIAHVDYPTDFTDVIFYRPPASLRFANPYDAHQYLEYCKMIQYTQINEKVNYWVEGKEIEDDPICYKNLLVKED